MNNFTIMLDGKSKKPLYEQIYDYISNEIKKGNLMENEKLPSKRSLAAHLQISTVTVETAYWLLAQEGYIRPVSRCGYFVCAVDSLLKPYRETAAQAKESRKEPVYKYDFKTNAVDIKSFPYATWAKLSKETMYGSPELLKVGEAKGDEALRRTIAKYLHELRGVNCSAEQIIIGAGMEYLLMLLDGILGEKAVYAVENPGYHKTPKILLNNGRRVCYIGLDESGMRLDELEESGANIAYLTPSHQFPTGVVMPVGRRAQFLKWASEGRDRYIVEDDYNSEFNFALKPIPSIQGFDTMGKVIYLSTFSRILAPSIRIAYMVLPKTLLEVYERKFGSYSSTVSRFEQHTLEKFISGGFLARHLNRVKNIYRKRRDALIEKLKSLPAEYGIKISGENAGLHLLVEMDASKAKKMIEAAKKNQIKLYTLSDYYFTEPVRGQNTFIFGYGGLETEEITEAMKLLFEK